MSTYIASGYFLLQLGLWKLPSTLGLEERHAKPLEYATVFLNTHFLVYFIVKLSNPSFDYKPRQTVKEKSAKLKTSDDSPHVFKIRIYF